MNFLFGGIICHWHVENSRRFFWISTKATKLAKLRYWTTEMFYCLFQKNLFYLFVAGAWGEDEVLRVKKKYSLMFFFKISNIFGAYLQLTLSSWLLYLLGNVIMFHSMQMVKRTKKKKQKKTIKTQNKTKKSAKIFLSFPISYFQT